MMRRGPERTDDQTSLTKRGDSYMTCTYVAISGCSQAAQQEKSWHIATSRNTAVAILIYRHMANKLRWPTCSPHFLLSLSGLYSKSVDTFSLTAVRIFDRIPLPAIKLAEKSYYDVNSILIALKVPPVLAEIIRR